MAQKQTKKWILCGECAESCKERMRNMYGNEREKEIMRLLHQNEYVTVEYLSKKIHISPSSIRRDLKQLELKGLINRSYGGAELKNSVNRQIPFFLRSHQNAKEKAMVAEKATSLVKPGDVLFLDSSTSTYFMLESLKSIRDITVITNSLTSMMLCSEYRIHSFFAGGQLNEENRSCCVGAQTEQFISSIHADLCFFSVQSLTADGTLYDCFANEIMPRRLMIQNSEKKAFLCDSSKTGHYSAYRLCSLSELDYVISDLPLDGYLDADYPKLRFLLGE